jgi:ABC-type phosphate/phosphonate transport system substrate-binding protein
MTTSAADLAGYRWTSAEPTSAHAYLMPAVHCILTKSPSRKPVLGFSRC